MQRGMNLAGQNVEHEKEKHNSEHKKVNRCPICGVGEIGAFCDQHLGLIKNYDWMKNYLNNVENVDEKILHVIGAAIGERVSWVINDVPIENGKLMIEEYLQRNLNERLNDGKKVKCSIWMEKTLKEILALQKAQNAVSMMINNKKENKECS